MQIDSFGAIVGYINKHRLLVRCYAFTKHFPCCSAGKGLPLVMGI